MFDMPVPDLWLGVAVVSATILFAAWREKVAGNLRDAKLLATVAALSSAGTVGVWLQ